MDIKDCFICGYYDDSGNGNYIVECSKGQVELYLKSLDEQINDEEFKNRLKQRLEYPEDFTLLIV